MICISVPRIAPYSFTEALKRPLIESAIVVVPPRQILEGDAKVIVKQIRFGIIWQQSDGQLEVSLRKIVLFDSRIGASAFVVGPRTFLVQSKRLIKIGNRRP